MAKPAAAPVPMLDPTTGKVRQVVAEDAAEAAKQGFRALSAEEWKQEQLQERYGGVGGMAAAGVEGAARGLTLGLSDLAAVEGTRALLGDQRAEAVRQHMAGVQAANTGSALLGEGIGMVAPMLVSGGAAGAAEAGAKGMLARGAAEAGMGARALEAATVLPRGVAALGEGAAGAARKLVGTESASALGRLGQRVLPAAAQMGAEGAAYGAGGAVSEAVLGDHELTAEHILAGAGKGFLLGAGLGGAIGGASFVGSEGGSALRKALSSGEGNTVGATARDWLKGVSDERTIKALGAQKTDINRLGKTVEDVERRMSEIADTVHTTTLADGSRLMRVGDSAADMAPRLTTAVEEAGEKLGAVRKRLYAVADASPEVSPDMGKLFQQVDDYLRPMRESPLASIRSKASKVEAELSGLREMQTGGTTIGLESLTKIRQSLDDIIYPKAVGKGVAPMAAEHAAELQQVRGMVEGAIEESVDKAAALEGGKLGEEYRSLKRQFRDLTQAKQMADGWTTRDMGNRVLSPTDYGSGFGGAMVAAASGAGGISTAVAGALSSAVHNLVRERGASAAAIVARELGGVGKVGALAAQSEGRLLEGVRTFMRGIGEAPRAAVRVEAATTAASLDQRPHETKQQAMERVSGQLASLSDPRALADHVARQTGDMHMVAPQTTAVLTQRAATTVNFLRSKLPPMGPDTRSLTPHLDKVRVPDAEIDKFARTLRAATDPHSVVADMKAGRPLTKESVEALRVVAPRLYDRIREEVVEGLRNAKKPPTYEQKLQIRTLFGIVADRSLDPAFVAQMQSGWSAMYGAADPQTSVPTRASAPSRPLTRFGGSMATSSQRLGEDNG